MNFKSRLNNFLSAVLLFGVLTGALWAAETSAKAAKRPADLIYKHAVVAADHPLASQAGIEILRRGGNVVDAAVATSFALSVVRPASCGLGGGGFMVIWNAEKQQSVALDYRERAPQKATREMYSKPAVSDKNIDLSRKGHLAIAVPGTVAGLCYAAEHFGTLDIKILLQPAIRLARDGVLIDEHQRKTQLSQLAVFLKNDKYRKRFGVLFKKYLNSGKPWTKSSQFHSPQLSALERISQHGKDGFYRGPVAKALVAEIRRGGGIISAVDLETTAAVVRKPLRGRFDRFDMLAMPPPSSGGVALIEILNILTAYEKRHPSQSLEKLGHNSPAYLHLLTEAMKHAFADRAEFLGDADFTRVPIGRLTRRDYADRLASAIDESRTKPLKSYGHYLPVNDSGTSHFSIIDDDGNAVACTETVNTAFGSYVVEPKFGIVLNNQMDDFAAVPGQPNAFGLIQSKANEVQPRKKPLSSMSPTILIQNGRAVHVVGGSGGPRIISSTLQVLLNMTRFGQTPTEAVGHPRIHHQWLPETLFVEEPLFQTVEKPLSQRGHKVQLRNNLASIQAVSRGPNGLRAASDHRKSGKPAGF